MNLHERKIILDKISEYLALISLDIEQHQSLNDLSLNVNAETWFMGVLNLVLGREFINLNTENPYAAKIDLVDHNHKEAIQVTSTTTKEKIDHTLTALRAPGYSGYDIKFLYLTGLPNLQARSVKAIKDEWGIEIEQRLIDRKWVFQKISCLDSDKLQLLFDQYFKILRERYTDVIAIDLAIHHLLRTKGSIRRSYDDDLGGIETDEKFLINNISKRIKLEITKALDYTPLLNAANFDENVLEELRQYVVDDLYKKVLIVHLKSKEPETKLRMNTISELHSLATHHKMDFSKILASLQSEIESKINTVDFNSMNITWIIVSYFFELCEVGVKSATAE